MLAILWFGKFWFICGIQLLVIRENLLQTSVYSVESYTSSGCLQVFRVHEGKLATLRCNADIQKPISVIGQMNHLSGKFLSFDHKESLQQLAQLQTSKLWLSRIAEMNPTAGVSKLKTAQLWRESLDYHWHREMNISRVKLPPPWLWEEALSTRPQSRAQDFSRLPERLITSLDH